MDGDGSFVPGELPALLAPLAHGEADLVLGSRLRNVLQCSALPPHQRLGNELFVGLLRYRHKISLTDLGPFRVIRRDALQSLNMQEFTYGWPLEMIVKTLRRQMRIIELPITFRPRFAGKSKVGGSLRASREGNGTRVEPSSELQRKLAQARDALQEVAGLQVHRRSRRLVELSHRRVSRDRDSLPVVPWSWGVESPRLLP